MIDQFAKKHSDDIWIQSGKNWISATDDGFGTLAGSCAKETKLDPNIAYIECLNNWLPSFLHVNGQGAKLHGSYHVPTRYVNLIWSLFETEFTPILVFTSVEDVYHNISRIYRLLTSISLK